MDDFDSSKLIEDKSPSEIPVEVVEEPKKDFNFMELINDPKIAALLGGCKDMFKKKEVNPDICEITIKAPSEVVLKLFKVSE